MRRILLALAISVLFAGCAGQADSGFGNKDILQPCSIVAADDIERICGFGEVGSFPASGDGMSFCMYSSGEAGSYNDGSPLDFLTIIYVPSSKSIEEIKDQFVFENSTDEAAITEEGVGVGERSFVSVYKNKVTGRTYQTTLVVEDGDSSMIMTDLEEDGAARCRGRLKEIGILALERLRG